MVKKESKSVCPKPLAALIEISNAQAEMEKATPQERKMRREAFYYVCMRHKADADLQRAATVLPDAIRIRIFFTHFGIQPTSGEVLRVLQWQLVAATPSLLPWPQHEFDRLSRLLDFPGFTSDRVKFCAIKKCSRIFWAKRITTEYCERQQCMETYKKQKHRQRKRSR